MLQYKRRNNKNNIPTKNSNNRSSLLTYCNWSYAPNYHIDLETLKDILKSFNQEYIPFYLRIFNETPNQVVSSFIEQYQISKSSVESVYRSLVEDGFKVKACCTV